MSRQFDIRREVVLEATPEQVWRAVTTGEGTAGWLWPMELGPDDRVTVSDEPTRYAVRTEGEDGWFNALEFVLEGRGGGTTVLRYVHSGIFVDDWDTQFDGANRHTDFYLHTLGEYLRHFPDRTATYLSVGGPDASATPEAVGALRRALGLADSAAPGDPVRVQVPGLEPLDAVVDHADPYFLGLRTGDALYRFFGRGTWGMPLALSVHHFGTVDREKAELAWKGWLDGLLGG